MNRDDDGRFILEEPIPVKSMKTGETYHATKVYNDWDGIAFTGFKEETPDGIEEIVLTHDMRALTKLQDHLTDEEVCEIIESC